MSVLLESGRDFQEKIEGDEIADEQRKDQEMGRNPILLTNQ